MIHYISKNLLPMAPCKQSDNNVIENISHLTRLGDYETAGHNLKKNNSIKNKSKGKHELPISYSKPWSQC